MKQINFNRGLEIWNLLKHYRYKDVQFYYEEVSSTRLSDGWESNIVTCVLWNYVSYVVEKSYHATSVSKVPYSWFKSMALLYCNLRGFDA